MVLFAIILLGLCLGSFVNALVWRLHEQENTNNSRRKAELSILHGRSMCPDCRHSLSSKDLVPVLSWVWLRGRCRYCHKEISWQYPVLEIVTATLFGASYLLWPYALQGTEWIGFGFWLVLLTGFMALAVYDLRWFLLPDRVVFKLMIVAGAWRLFEVIETGFEWSQLTSLILSVAIAGGIFYVLFQLSAGRWIGGGDVKLGWLLGLTLADPFSSALMLFLAALLGSVFSLPLLLLNIMDRKSKLPFGPFLLAATIIVVLTGQSLLIWYEETFLLALR